MNKKLVNGQLYSFLKEYEDKTEFDKLFEERGLPRKERKTVLHFYTLFFIIETDDTLRFYSTTEDFLFDYRKSEIPTQLRDIFALYTTKFSRVFTINSRKLNYTRAKKIWTKTDEDFPIASIEDPLTITYSDKEKKYSLGLLYVYRQINGQTEQLDLRDIDEEFLREIFQMDVSYFPDQDFSKPSIFFDFYTKLLIQITQEIPRQMRRIDIEINVVNNDNSTERQY